MIKYLTVIISDQPIAQREGMPGIIETRAVNLDPYDMENTAQFIRDEFAELSAAALDRLPPEEE